MLNNEHLETHMNRLQEVTLVSPLSRLVLRESFGLIDTHQTATSPQMSCSLTCGMFLSICIVRSDSQALPDQKNHSTRLSVRLVYNVRGGRSASANEETSFRRRICPGILVIQALRCTSAKLSRAILGEDPRERVIRALFMCQPLHPSEIGEFSMHDELQKRRRRTPRLSTV